MLIFEYEHFNVSGKKLADINRHKYKSSLNILINKTKNPGIIKLPTKQMYKGNNFYSSRCRSRAQP